MQHYRRGIALAATLACAIGLTAHARQRFTSSTSLLTLDVSVLDRDGKPVTGLSADDFVVQLNGKPQAVKTVIFLATDTVTSRTSGRSATLSGAAASNEPASPPSQPDPKLFVLLLDDLSIYPTESKGLFVAAERFLDTIRPQDAVGLATTSGLVTVNPSLDRAALLKKLKHAFGGMNDPRREGQKYVGLIEALLIDNGSEAALRHAIERECGIPPNVMASKNLGQIIADYECPHELMTQARYNAAFARRNTRTQLEAYEAVIKAMAPAPGVKQLVIMTGGVAMAPADSVDFIPVAKAAAAAGVQISMLMEEPEFNMSSSSAKDFTQDQLQMLQQAQTVAELSGGQFFRVIGQADRFFERILTSSAAVYRIGVDVPPGAPPDNKFEVSVKVNRPGVRALASRFAAPPVPVVPPTSEEQVTRAIKSGIPSYAVPITMNAEVEQPEPDSHAIHVTIDVPGDVTGPLSGIFGIVDANQQLRSGHRELTRSADGKTYHLDFLVPATPATYELRFAVADAAGAVGAVTQKVVVK